MANHKDVKAPVANQNEGNNQQKDAKNQGGFGRNQQENRPENKNRGNEAGRQENNKNNSKKS